MASIINSATFTATDKQPDHDYWIEGTVDVTLRGQTRSVRATKSTYDGSITAHGMTGRYQTGTKVWPATATQRIDPLTGKAWDSVDFGRDDRAAKFQKTSALHFA